MKAVDRWLQRWRMKKASSHIPCGARVLDVGCGDGSLFSCLGNRISSGIGIEPSLDVSIHRGNVRLIPGSFLEVQIPPPSFDAVVLLAVFEHFPEESLSGVVAEIRKLLVPDGRVILTIPSPGVDIVLKLLVFLKLAHGMSLEEHHGYDVARTKPLFVHAGFVLEHHETFQMGLNNLFVFRKAKG